MNYNTDINFSNTENSIPKIVKPTTNTIATEKTLTTHRQRRHNTPKNKPQSIAKSMLLSIEEELGLTDLFGGEMTHLSFDCPKNLRNAFVAEAKLNGTSVCQILVKRSADYVTTSRIQRHALGDTLSKIVDVKFPIENINFTQNVQSRPRRYVSNNSDAVLKVEGSDVCMIGSCGKPAVEVMTYQPKGKEPKDYRVCACCSSKLLADHGNVWRFKKLLPEPKSHL